MILDAGRSRDGHAGRWMLRLVVVGDRLSAGCFRLQQYGHFVGPFLLQLRQNWRLSLRKWRHLLENGCLVHHHRLLIITIIINITYKAKALNIGHPPYLAELLQYHQPTRSTRSSASHSLSVPRHNLSFGSRALRTSAPKIWNSLLPHILQSQTLSSFRHRLKTHYFQSAYSAP